MDIALARLSIYRSIIIVFFQSTYSFYLKGDASNCYSDKPRILAYKGSSSDMTPAVCKEKCKGLGFAFSGVQWYKECWCGNKAPSIVKQLDMEKCNTMCSGDKSQRCGGDMKANIIKV